MCGICGIVSLRESVKRDTLLAMTKRLEHRGPDAEGLWTDEHCGFGHRRLAVIDLAGGVQPMLAQQWPPRPSERTVATLTPPVVAA